MRDQTEITVILIRDDDRFSKAWIKEGENTTECQTQEEFEAAFGTEVMDKLL